MAVIWAITTGYLLTVSRLQNARLGQHIGHMHSSFVNHIVGLALATVVLAVGFAHFPTWQRDIPWMYYCGGLLGVFIVYGSNYSIAQLGATVGSIIIMGFQMLTSGILDHMEWLGAKGHPLDVISILGIVLILAGGIVIQTDKTDITMVAGVEE